MDDYNVAVPGPSNRGVKDEEDDIPQNLYVANARQAITFKLVYSARDVTEKSLRFQRSFKPDLVFQIFGESEAIYGYRHLKINIYVLAKSANFYVELEHSKVAKSTNGPKPDNILRKLTPWLPETFYTKKNEFLQKISQDEEDPTSKMFGTKIDEFEAYNKNDEKVYQYVITHCSGSEPGFTDFHNRFESFIVWYIDAASHVDATEENWIFLYVYERRNLPKSNQFCYYPVGYLSIYKFFHFPDKIRVRIAQVFVLPPCQRSGIGVRLLHASYKLVSQMPNVIDIAVEDPCEGFTRMRDVLDCQLLMQIECFKYPNIAHGFKQVMFSEANDHFKINKRQCRRVYEILRMAYVLLHSDNEAYEELYNEIKNYMEAPHKREREAIKKKRIFMARRLCGDETVLYQPNDNAKDVTRSVAYHMQDIRLSARQVAKKLRREL